MMGMILGGNNQNQYSNNFAQQASQLQPQQVPQFQQPQNSGLPRFD